MSIFEQATRAKLRFQTARGNLSVEQLWDLPLDKGDITLHTLVEELLNETSKTTSDKLSFFKKAVPTNKTAELKFEIVKHIVTTRVAEMENKLLESIKETEKNELDKLIAAKKAEAKANLTLEELEAMRAKL